MIGQVLLKRFKVVRQIGEGGMSSVYQGRQLDLDRAVAIKVLLPQLVNQPKVMDHFRREMHILSQFQHAHAIAYYDGAPDGNPPCLVMEYVRGIELGELLQRRERFRPERVGRLLGQLCDVLQAAHDAGIVHRDIKPSNIQIMFPNSPVEKIKLMDFGLAKMSSMFYLSPVEMVNVAQPTASGTPDYISPEEIRGNEVDRRSDVYSLGVVMYEMLTGQRPFMGTSLEDLLFAHQEQQPRSFRELGLANEVSPALEQVVLDCLAKRPEDRIASCAALAGRYEKALGRKIWVRTRTMQMPKTDDSKPAVIYHARPGSAPGTQPAMSSGVRPALSSGVQPALSSVRPALSGVRPAVSSGVRPAVAGGLRATLASNPAAMVADAHAAERHAITHRLTAPMIESMAMIKLRGFIHDLGGEIVETVPGMIKVQLYEEVHIQGGMFGLFAAQKKKVLSLEIEMRMEKVAGGQLAITLVLRSPSGTFNGEGKTRCEKICRDLNAYLMGVG